jgi:hypothetical protein
MQIPDDDRAREAKAVLDRASRESTGFAESHLARLAAHLAGRDADRQDGAELWGRRIGRTLGLVFLAVLIVNLFTGWFF